MKEKSFIRRVVFRRAGIKPIILASFGIIIDIAASFSQTYSCGNHKVWVCHKGKNTLCIDESAVQAHLDHGDYLGPCGSSIICDVIATGGEITCNDTLVTLKAISSNTSITYSWSGPNNFTSSLNSPSTSISGIYIVTVSDTANGCTASDSALVTKDTLVPGAIADGENITCANTSATLSGSSGALEAIFKWTGPRSYTSTKQNAVTSIPGEYILSVSNPTNGCVSFDSIIIQQNIAVPEGVEAIVQDTLTCRQNTVALTGISITNDVKYNWLGPNNYNSTEQNPFVTHPGFYRLVVTAMDNGCSLSDVVLVEQNYSYPEGISATVSGKLTCSDTIVTITGVSGSDNVNYFWSDKDGFMHTLPNVDVSLPGTYKLIVTDKISGCKDSISVSVEQDIESPSGLLILDTDTLNCTVSSVILSATSTTEDVVYLWKGPQENAISNKRFIETNIPGNYQVLATNPLNNCTSVKYVTVVEEECQQ